MQVHDHEGARRLQLEERALSLDTRVFTLLSPGPDDPMLSLDMSMQQLKVLLLVDGLGIPSMGDLAHLLHIGQSAISGLVDRLVDHGWVRREEDHLDRRIVRVQSTDGGHALVQRIRMAGRSRLQDRKSTRLNSSHT